MSGPTSSTTSPSGPTGDAAMAAGEYRALHPRPDARRGRLPARLERRPGRRRARAVLRGRRRPRAALRRRRPVGDDLLRYENTGGGAELFPHLYRPLPVAAVVEVTDIGDPADLSSRRPDARAVRSTGRRRPHRTGRRVSRQQHGAELVGTGRQQLEPVGGVDGHELEEEAVDRAAQHAGEGGPVAGQLGEQLGQPAVEAASKAALSSNAATTICSLPRRLSPTSSFQMASWSDISDHTQRSSAASRSGGAQRRRRPAAPG